jgi:sugar O-acyltransferase (sialic acid O-acetyltransferase NeuD family)
MNPKKLAIMGFGGHARSIADVALACGYTELLFVDENAGPDENFLGHRVVSHFDAREKDTSWYDAFAASGDNVRRSEQCGTIEQLGLTLVSLISPIASVGVGSLVAPGCFVGHHAHIGPMAKIGRACIINTGAIVEHESYVGDYSHVSVNATMAGRSKLGAFSMLGAGATIIDGLSVIDGVTIGAGAVVNCSIEIRGTYVGIPARRLK